MMDLQLSQGARSALANYAENARLGRRTALETSSRPVRLDFDPRRPKPAGRNAEVVDPTHPLLRWLDAEITQEKAHGSTPVALSVPESAVGLSAGLYVFASQKWMLKGIRTETVIGYRAISLDDKDFLDPLEAERLVATSAKLGAKLAYGALDDVQLSKVISDLERCSDALLEGFAARCDAFEAENERRCDQQETSARRMARRKIEDLNRRAEKMDRERKERGARLARSQIRRQEEILQSKLDRVERRRMFDTDTSDVSSGLILVE